MIGIIDWTYFFFGGGGGCCYCIAYWLVIQEQIIFSYPIGLQKLESTWRANQSVDRKMQVQMQAPHCPPIQPLNTSKPLQKLHINSWWTMVNLIIIKNSLFLNNSFNVFYSCLALNSLKTWQMKSFKNECFLHFCIHTKDRSCPRLYHK